MDITISTQVAITAILAVMFIGIFLIDKNAAKSLAAPLVKLFDRFL